MNQHTPASATAASIGAADKVEATTAPLRRPKKVAFVHSGAFFHLATLNDPAVKAQDLVELYAPELTAEDLADCDAVFLAARQHPDVLERIAPLIVDFAHRPGTKLYVDGENAPWQWLPGTDGTGRGTNFWAWRTGEDVGRRSVNRDHFMWNYLNDFSVHWHYHGVLAPPAGATPLVVLEELPVTDTTTGPGTDPWGGDYLAIPGHPNVLLYHDDATFPGEVVVSTMDCAYHHGSGFMPGASALLYRMITWLRD
ncbi:hypothetical protein ACFWGD_02785 [Corynebacterium sp. NPDC060344]|uniref:hypothetical protein n=1 Tax=Corynebacterium sp. NPDC060344 TaxID=3347101 RepID=UPI00365E5799